jgi:uncharacterized SAM-binding protein YcdF (DUF218 family)
VRCEPLGDTLARKGITRIDLLHIDTEGHDFEVIKQLDLKQQAPNAILYEHIHLSNVDKIVAERLLRHAGYDAQRIFADTLALKGALKNCIRAREKGRQWSLRRSLIGMFVLAIVAACGWLGREYVLLGAAELWIVSDPVSRANAIVVLGGGLETRPFVAAELLRRGLADKILISQGSEERAVSIGAVRSHSELNREILLKLGVPPGAIETFGTASRNTRDEAIALREWAEGNVASAFIVPSEIFSARRVRWIFRHEFSGTGVSIEVPSFESPGYTRWDWWKTEEGLIAFQNEFMKYIYYRLKY